MKRLPFNSSFRRTPESSLDGCARSDGVRRDDVVTEPAPNHGRRAAVLGLAGLLVACAAKPVEPERFFRPALARPVLRGDTPLRIVVEPVEVHGIYADRAFVSRAADGAYRQSTGRSWIGPPSMLLGDLLVEQLRAAYGEDSVFSPQARVGADLSLRTQLRRLERMQGVEGGDQALLAIEFVLTGPGGTLLGSRVFEASLPAGSSAADYVAAQSQLLDQAVATLLPVVDQALIAAAAARTSPR